LLNPPEVPGWRTPGLLNPPELPGMERLGAGVEWTAGAAGLGAAALGAGAGAGLLFSARAGDATKARPNNAVNHSISDFASALALNMFFSFRCGTDSLLHAAPWWSGRNFDLRIARQPYHQPEARKSKTVATANASGVRHVPATLILQAAGTRRVASIWHALSAGREQKVPKSPNLCRARPAELLQSHRVLAKSHPRLA
jgi:hypothetical protein